MQSGGRVIEAAAGISYGDLMHLPRERRASHLLDMARGHLQAGQRDRAAATLLEADQLAPEEVRCRNLAKVVITDLVRSYPPGLSPLVGVTKLARVVGVAV
jgi:Ribonuclease G/E